MVDALTSSGSGEAEERKFDSISVGDRAETEHAIRQSDVDVFASLSGDFNPLHVDEQYARTTSYGKPVAHGMLGASFISAMIGMKLPGKGALWMSQTLEFLRPVFVGDRLRIQAVVTQKSLAMRTLVMDIKVGNQRGEDVVTGTARVKVLESMEREEKAMQNEGRVALVTGASGGIGAAVAEKLAEAGFLVALNYRESAERAHALVDALNKHGLHCAAFQADVSDSSAVRAMFAEIENALGTVQDIIHCAAPIPDPTPFDALTWGDYQRQIDVQVGGAVNCAQAGLARMAEAGGGSVVLIGSIYSDAVPPVHQSAYVVAKAGLSALARTLAVEFGPKGVRVNVVSPGMTQTSMIAAIPEKAKLLAKMQAPLRRLADPEDIASAVLFLVGSGARHITGETVRVCGGAVMI